MAGRVKVIGDEVVTEPKPPRKRPKLAPEIATQDMHIPRPDLGRGATTFVSKGERIPDAARRFLT